MPGDALVIGLAKKVKRGKASEDDAGEDEDAGMSLDEVEADAYADMVAAQEEGDEEKGRQALKDFVVACIKRQGKGDY